jgi:hypothetical protein
MDVALTNEESEALLQALSSYCSDLRMEIADTDNPEFRRGLRHEREVLEHVVEKLVGAAKQSDERDEAGNVVVRVISIWST